MKSVLIWGRYGNYGPDYPRNRVIESVLRELGHEVTRFLPRLSFLADWEYIWRGGKKPDLIWVPCFRQRDLPAASRYARRHHIPLVFDPLISAYDKQVHERQKFAPDSAKARRLLAWERGLFQRADWLIADTAGHADYFADELGVARERLVVIPVGAEEAVFAQQPWPVKPPSAPLVLTFFGTFIGLQGVDVLAEAIRTYEGPPVRWRLIGEGPMREACQTLLADLCIDGDGPGVVFEPWGPLLELSGRLASSDAILGIFGTTDKACRVIPNKVYQGLAIGRPVITASTSAYPESLRANEDQGLFWALPGDPASIQAAVNRLQARRTMLLTLGQAALTSYQAHFSNQVIAAGLNRILSLIEH